MKPAISFLTVCMLLAIVLCAATVPAEARPPIKADFFNLYPGADGTQLTDLPSNSKHCGVCHFDFDGGGRRNPYGVAVEALIQLGLSNTNAMIAIENLDSDGDGFTNLEEITNSVFSNTPTFPGLYTANVPFTMHVTQSEVLPYVTPNGSADTTPPAVTLISPNGGEVIAAAGFSAATYTASDASGIAWVNLYLSDDGGTTFKKVVDRAPDTGTVNWFVPNLPGPQTVIKIEAVDNGGNMGEDTSDAVLTVTPQAGLAPTTLRDIHLDGTQPFEGAVLEDPSTHCVSCHGDYDPAVEPWDNWRGSMMGQAMRDPLFLACLTVAEQDAPSVGDLCIRCHSPGGWQEGRSLDTGGGLINQKDRQGIQCAFCHRAVDRNYVMGVSPVEDQAVLASLDALPQQYGNGQFINDPHPLFRGPFGDDTPTHEFVQSSFLHSADMCGTCHDVSNPVYDRTGPADYTLNAFGQEHPTGYVRDMFPIERTFSEWSASEYATTGVYAPQFAGNKPDGIVSTCQDCHMRDVTGTGCNQSGTPSRTDLPLHDLMGGNAFIPQIIDDFYPGEVDTATLSAARSRAVHMLQLAATLEVTPKPYGVDVKVTNEGAHKLPSGYPEGRRVWINVVARDGASAVVYESGHYDFATGELAEDEDLKVYETHPGLSPGLAAALGMPAGQSFHFVLNDTVWFDNRIPPRGFTNAAFVDIQSPPVGATYADGQYWDTTHYFLPPEAVTVTVTLYYQTITKEYVEFLRDANTTNTAGQDLYDAWVAAGHGAPVTMAQATVGTSVSSVDDGTGIPAFRLAGAAPNPFSGRTTIRFETAARGPVRLDLYDIAGRHVRTLVDAVLEAEAHQAVWNGRDDRGATVAAGIYFMRLQSGSDVKTGRLVLTP